MFKNIGINTKVLLSYILIVTIFVVSIIFTIIPSTISDYENELENKLLGLVEFVSANCITAIEFEDTSYASSILNSSLGIDEIERFGIYTKKRDEFYIFSRSQKYTDSIPANFYINRHSDYIQISKPLVSDEELIGYVTILGSKDKLNSKIEEFIHRVTIVLFFIVIIILFLIKRTQKDLVEPIILLSETAQKVQTDGNYNIQITHNSNDEVGILYKHFQEMMSTIYGKSLEIKYQNEILEQKVRERTKEFELAKDDAEKANKLKSIFLANMSHEIRTPLNAIIGYTQILKDVIKKQENLEKINIIRSSGKHLLNIINEILDMSKIEAGKMTIEYNDICLEEFLNNIIYMLKVKAEEKNIELNVIIDSTSPKYFRTDMAKLRQSIINMLGNAIKFTTIGHVQVSTSMQNNILYFEIEDTGKGIDDGLLETVFEPFRQGANEPGSGGTGLGMAITKKFSELLGGDLTVRSELNVGSTFVFSIPFIEAESYQKPKQTSNKVTMNGNGKHILIADDVIVNRMLLLDVLKPYNFTLGEVGNGKDAVEYCRSNKPDMVLMDIRMPVMNGYESTEIIKKEYPEIIVFAVSASVVEEKIQRIFACGCSEYIIKPFNTIELLTKIQQYLELENNDIEEHYEITFNKDIELEQSEKNEIIDFVDIGDYEGLKEYLYTQLEEATQEKKRSLKKLIGLAENYEEQEIINLVK